MKRFKIATAEFAAAETGPLRLISSADLARFTFAVAADDHPRKGHHEATFYCPYEDCDAREVTVAVKGDKPLGTRPTRCPLCGCVMDMLHYNAEVPLLVVE